MNYNKIMIYNHDMTELLLEKIDISNSNRKFQLIEQNIYGGSGLDRFYQLQNFIFNDIGIKEEQLKK